MFTTQKFADAIRKGFGCAFDPETGRFTFTYEGFCGEETLSASVREVQDAIEPAARTAFREYFDEDLPGLLEYLNSFLDEAEGTHPLGEIVERRVVEVESVGFLGTGAGTFARHEVLVRLKEDWWDDTGAFAQERKAGEEVWLPVTVFGRV